MALGNHEFDFGVGNLVRLVRRAKFPVLAANISGLRDVKPYVILAPPRVPCRIAIIGLVTPETPHITAPGATKGVRFSDPAASVRALMKEVEADLWILATHLGREDDLKLAADVPGLALVCGGHSHTPVNEKVGETLVLQTHSHGLSLAIATQEGDPGGILCCSDTFDDIVERPAYIDASPIYPIPPPPHQPLDGYSLSLTTTQPGGASRMNMRDANGIFDAKNVRVKDDIYYTFWCRGLAPSSGLRDVEMQIQLTNGTDLRGGHTCWDKVKLTVLKLDIDVTGPPAVSDFNEVSVGGLVVLNDDGNGAPRAEVNVAAVEPGTWSGTLVVPSSSTRLELYSGQTGGTALDQNVYVSTADLPKTYRVQGHIYSQSMRDVEMQVGVQDDTGYGDRAAFTVLCANIVRPISTAPRRCLLTMTSATTIGTGRSRTTTPSDSKSTREPLLVCTITVGLGVTKDTLAFGPAASVILGSH